MTVGRVVDTSVLVAGFSSWHEQHDVARRALRDGAGVVGHAIAESYSVLTRLPEPHRAAPELVRDFLAAACVATLTLDVDFLRALPASLVACGVSGGATFDGLIALTAAIHDVTLLSLDRRAAETYRRCGVRFELLAG
ncbi:MAG: PIN domain-containing protein [Actinomycetia bacterium]|nr:PIN domain-containing protein [Actinomycetes bacterium]